jgi:amidase
VPVTTFITRLPTSGDGIRLAVKDLIDVAGVPTTAGSRALAATAAPAESDAPCLAGARAAGARIVGKANLDELAFGASGVNAYFGTPVNPLDPGRVPGGSSSGAAVAVAGGEADLAYGSDTGGSIRVPSAFCGITGLKTTHGRIALAGVWPLAPSMDTIGPMARDVAGVAAALRGVDVLALATVPFFPPWLEAAVRPGYLALTSPVNLAGLPALALPVPTGKRLPASLQLIGGPSAEALLLATGAAIEAAVSKPGQSSMAW